MLQCDRFRFNPSVCDPTGPIAGSTKTYRDVDLDLEGVPRAKVPFRRVDLSNGEHLDLYDTSWGRTPMLTR